MKIDLDYKLKGRFQLTKQKVNSEGEVISSEVVADWFDNLITDLGIDGIGHPNSGYNIGWCVVGSGNTAPLPSDTSLASYVATSDTTSPTWSGVAQISSMPYYITYTCTQTFLAGNATGNLSEVGMTTHAAGKTTGATDPLWSRALILDGSGNPTTITVLPDEILNVTYQLIVYLPNGGNDITGTFNQTIDGTVTNFSYTLRPGGMSNIGGLSGGNWGVKCIAGTAFGPAYLPGSGLTNGALNPVTSPREGSVPTGSTNSTYVSGNYYIDTTITWDTSAGNTTFNKYFLNWDGHASYQLLISPAIVKDNTKVYSITVRNSWSRHS